MGLLKSKTDILTLKLCPQFSSEDVTDLVVEQKQILFGSAPSCDVVLPKEFAHHYHAVVNMGEEGMAEIIDLEGHLGVFINGQRVKKGTFGAGDIVKIGNYDFVVEEGITAQPVLDHDQHLEASKADLPPVVPMAEVPQGKYTLIDGEACYLDFDDEHFTIIHEHPANYLKDLNLDEFVYDLDDDAGVIKTQKDNVSLEVMTMANGFILSVDYVDLKDGDYFLTGGDTRKNKVHFDLYSEDEQSAFFSIEGGEFIPREVAGFDREMLEGQNLHTQNEFVYHYYNSPVQIFVRPAKTPPTLKSEMLLERDRGFWQSQGRTFGVGMLIALLLLLINIEEEVPPPKKTLAVVYKRIPKQKMKEKQTAQLKQQNKTNEEYKKVVTKKAKGQPAPAPKKVAKAKPQKTKTQPKKAPKKTVAKVDAYKNPFKSNFKKLLSKSGSLASTKSKSVSTSTLTNTSVTANSNAKGSRKVANFKGKIGDLGKHSAIDSSFSAGAKGLVDKRGIVTASASTKTVVLGAMDPEVLRRILEEYIPQFRHCYQQELEFNSEKLKGVVDLQFTINKTGKATKIKVLAKRARFSKRGTNCMAGVLRIIDFPKPKGGGIVDVRQPLNFFSEKG